MSVVATRANVRGAVFFDPENGGHEEACNYFHYFHCRPNFKTKSRDYFLWLYIYYFAWFLFPGRGTAYWSIEGFLLSLSKYLTYAIFRASRLKSPWKLILPVRYPVILNLSLFQSSCLQMEAIQNEKKSTVVEKIALSDKLKHTVRTCILIYTASAYVYGFSLGFSGGYVGWDEAARIRRARHSVWPAVAAHSVRLSLISSYEQFFFRQAAKFKEDQVPSWITCYMIAMFSIIFVSLICFCC